MINIAIDGPAGAGKSTISKAAARRLGYIYIDTGALYRTIGLAALRQNALGSEQEIISVLSKDLSVDLRYDEDGQKMFLNGEDVTGLIRTPQASMAASKVSAVPQVRQYLLELQRRLARENNCIMDGRDIGTVILPDADVKIFLTADPKARAKRRYDELKLAGSSVSFRQVYDDMLKRDYDDSHRAAAPLKMADDAILLDTGDIGLEESIELVISTIKNSLGEK